MSAVVNRVRRLLGCCPDTVRTGTIDPAVMGGLGQSQMNSEIPYISVQEHRTPSSVLGAVGPWIFSNEEAAAFLLPHLETASDSLAAHLAANDGRPKPSCLWLSCWSLWPTQTSQSLDPETPEEEGTNKLALDITLAPQLDMVISINQSGPKCIPVFIFTPRVTYSATLHARVRAVVERLASLVPFDSVPSVFGPATLSMTFARMWEDVTGMRRRPEPSRAMYLVRCNPTTRSGSPADHEGTQEVTNGVSGGIGLRRSLIRIRVAGPEDVKEVAELLYGMMNEMPHAITVDMEAFASCIITSSSVHLLEVLEAHISTDYWRLVSFCEIVRHGRRSARVGRIFTLTDMRGQGYATYLLESLLDSLFQAGTTSMFAYLPVSEARIHSLFLRTGFEDCEQEEFVEWSFEHAGPTFW